TQTAVRTPQPPIKLQKTASARVFLRQVGAAIVRPFLPMTRHGACMPPRRWARCDTRGLHSPNPLGMDQPSPTTGACGASVHKVEERSIARVGRVGKVLYSEGRSEGFMGPPPQLSLQPDTARREYADLIGLHWKPALPRDIAPQVRDLTAVMELVNQQNAQKIPDFFGATGREGELALQVGWRQGGQDGQRFFPHGCGITLQGGNGGLECHHLLEGMPDPSIVRLGRHAKFFMPMPSYPS